MQRAAAYQAYYEMMPLRKRSLAARAGHAPVSQGGVRPAGRVLRPRHPPVPHRPAERRRHQAARRRGPAADEHAPRQAAARLAGGWPDRLDRYLERGPPAAEEPVRGPPAGKGPEDPAGREDRELRRRHPEVRPLHLLQVGQTPVLEAVPAGVQKSEADCQHPEERVG